jgi:hypothetical protein
MSGENLQVKAVTRPPIPSCDLLDCRFRDPPVVELPFDRCQLPRVEQCVSGQCACVLVSPYPTVQAEPVAPEDACSIVMVLIVAGVKKTLLSCWVSGQ